MPDEPPENHESEVQLKFQKHEDADRFLHVFDQLIHHRCGQRSITNSLRRLARLAVVILKKPVSMQETYDSSKSEYVAI